MARDPHTTLITNYDKVLRLRGFTVHLSVHRTRSTVSNTIARYAAVSVTQVLQHSERAH